MEPFDTKIASLTYLTNPLYQQIIKQQKEIKATNNKADIKFYRKRITALTKDMLKGDMPANNYIRHIYDTYVNGLIAYFKTLDTTDIIQGQYVPNAGAAEPHVGACDVDNDIDGDASAAGPEADNDGDTFASTNKYLIRKPASIATLDNFVLKQPHETSDTRIIPIILQVDLKEPSLKTKGVKEKIKKQPAAVVTKATDIHTNVAEQT
jgi:hypothetical protein